MRLEVSITQDRSVSKGADLDRMDSVRLHAWIEERAAVRRNESVTRGSNKPVLIVLHHKQVASRMRGTGLTRRPGATTGRYSGVKRVGRVHTGSYLATCAEEGQQGARLEGRQLGRSSAAQLRPQCSIIAPCLPLPLPLPLPLRLVPLPRVLSCASCCCG